MRIILIGLLLATQSTFASDFGFSLKPDMRVDASAGAFFDSLPVKADSYTCSGELTVDGKDPSPYGKVKISLFEKETATPSVEISAMQLQLKIGNGFVGSFRPRKDCGYLFAGEPARMIYVCNRSEWGAVTMPEVMQANMRASFSADMVCWGRGKCLKLSRCTDREVKETVPLRNGRRR